MSTITHIETSKGKFLAVKVATGLYKQWTNPLVDGEINQRLWWPYSNGWMEGEVECHALPEGNWQLVSVKTTRNYSEEEAAQVVDEPVDENNLYHSADGWQPPKFKDYRRNQYTDFDAIESLSSLLESHGLSKENEYVILRKL